MKPAAIKRVVGDLLHMTLPRAEVISELVLQNSCERLLELGFNHGVSSCYLAGALQEQGRGHLTTIDLTSARDRVPNIEQLLSSLGLESYVTIHYEPTSYLWRLMRMLEEDSSERFDFLYLDGAHDWFTDGFAFLLVDRLLLPGGLIVLDDLDWTFHRSLALPRTDRVRRMPEDERTTPQIRKVWELLVQTHPRYGDFEEQDGWALARKKANPTAP